MDCNICCFKFTPTLRRKYTCFHCDESICCKCLITYISNEIENPKCLFCNVKINIVDLKHLVSKSKFNFLKKKHSESLFDSQKKRLKFTFNLLQEKRKIIEIEKIKRLLRNEGISEDRIKYHLENTGYLKNFSNKFNKCFKCENVLLDNFCSSCKIYTCEKCNCKKDVNHECDSETLQNLDFINKNCHKCPKCETYIEKNDGGCDQMFCVKCKTIFSWTTNRIIPNEESYHNPHYFEWQKEKTGNVERNSVDHPCQGYFLMREIDFLEFINDQIINEYSMINKFLEYEDYENEKLRILYLTKKISMKTWKKMFLQRNLQTKLFSDLKPLLLICLDNIYNIVLNYDCDIQMLKNLFDSITHEIRFTCRKYDDESLYKINIFSIFLPVLYLEMINPHLFLEFLNHELNGEE